MRACRSGSNLPPVHRQPWRSVMATQTFGSSLHSPAIGVNRTGCVLGCLLGAMHLGWVILVATGAAQPVADFVYWFLFIRPVWVIDAFEPIRAAGLVAL